MPLEDEVTVPEAAWSSPAKDTQQPKAPNPSLDPGVVPDISSLLTEEETELPGIGEFVVADLEPLIAMRILGHGVQALADMTGDVPATPPATISLRELRSDPLLRPRSVSHRPVTPPSSVSSHDLRSPFFKDIPIGTPEAASAEPLLIGPAPNISIRAQNDAIARKFFSRKPAPVSINEYLRRLHRYCPMSTAVYLAAGVYIMKLTVEQRFVPVTPRTAHRLLLGSLRVAMKALEDLSYPHERFAGVGGVSQEELAKLEISLCYLIDWELKVDIPTLYEKTKSLQQLSAAGTSVSNGFTPRLPFFRDKANRRQTVT